MANNYSQFSETIEGLTAEETAWINTVLKLDANDLDDDGTGGERSQLMSELSLEGDHDLDMWPCFEWAIQGKEEPYLWLHSEEGHLDEHLIWFVQAFINKFRPDFIFSVTGSATCSKPRIGEFGGWWLVISKDDVQGGNTWDAAKAAVEALQVDSTGQ